jgi:hypothetical protein
MNKLKWIDSAGGPLILISDKTVGLWSGILKRSAYLVNPYKASIQLNINYKLWKKSWLYRFSIARKFRF